MSTLIGRLKKLARRMLPDHVRYQRNGEAFLRRGEREVALLPQLIRPGTVMVDVGANLGGYTYCALKLAKPSRIICVEPVDELAQYLRRAASKLRLPVQVYQAALSDRVGEKELFIPRGNGNDKNAFATLERRQDVGILVRVPLMRLDDICGEVSDRISFIKIDVEGHELGVLRGGRETLREHTPVVMVEIETRHSMIPVSETFYYMSAIGYRCEYLEPRTRIRTAIGDFDVERHQKSTLPDSDDYVNNFIFTSREAGDAL